MARPGPGSHHLEGLRDPSATHPAARPRRGKSRSCSKRSGGGPRSRRTRSPGTSPPCARFSKSVPTSHRVRADDPRTRVSVRRRGHRARSPARAISSTPWLERAGSREAPKTPIDFRRDGDRAATRAGTGSGQQLDPATPAGEHVLLGRGGHRPLPRGRHDGAGLCRVARRRAGGLRAVARPAPVDASLAGCRPIRRGHTTENRSPMRRTMAAAARISTCRPSAPPRPVS